MKPLNRRTTLTLPAKDLADAKSIARSRKVSLSTVVAEALRKGLPAREVKHNAERYLAAMRASVAGLTEDEILLLNGFMMEPIQTRRRPAKK